MKILVVDDSAVLRRRIRHELEANGHSVVDLPDGLQAIEKLEEIKPELITLDIDMPGIDGYETCRRIRQGEGTQKSDIPIVFITANDTVQSRQKGYQAGCNEYVGKPFLPGELGLAIDRAKKARDGLHGRTVLIVDDSAAIRSLLTVGLKARGLNILGAADGEEALQTFKENSDEIDLVITDYIMPKMNGDELCSKIRNELGHRELPIVFLSSSTEEDRVLKMFRSGATDFITKPFSMDEVQARAAVHINSKVLGDQLRNTVSQLKKAHTMKDKFLSICSHDLRAPLSGIEGLTELMLMDESLSSENIEYLKLVKSSSEFLCSIINDLLQLGKFQSEQQQLELAPTDLVGILDSCISNLTHMASPKNISIDKLSSGENRNQFKILGDPNALRRIFNNLISNSIKFSHPGGRVTIELIQDVENQRAKVGIIDHGIGIPEDKIAGLFDPNQKSSQLGTSGEQSFGLGMVIVKQLIDLHAGEVEVASKQNEGTSITVTLPLA